MRIWAVSIAAALLALPGLAQAGPTRPDPNATVQAVMQAERDFAAYTKVHGYTKGFLDWSAPDAITFQPQAVRIHDKLAAALAADPTLADKPTQLRWAPFYAGSASTGDVAFDLGPWTVEGGDRAGWFFTIWQKQADGSWRWTVDGGAGSDTPGNLPAPDKDLKLISNVDYTIPNGLNEGTAQDDSFNAALGKIPAADAFAALRGHQTTIASDGVPPYISGYFPYPEGDGSPPAPPGANDKAAATKTAALAARPAPGLTWSRDGQGAARSGDFVYTYGHANAADGSYVGHYVRVWQKLTPDPGNWVLVVDVFQK